ncbi:hypothetical protein EL18_02597 [Nitratireductor basaltis]|uniref:Uncharacterized protein n=1 Tax=Nitratireductor basaltis TaxID=472175 RepID=A0A084U5W1_9HYPH|nr:hypothetical protein EL18_02597 [Nitratireductor basaltis]
MKIDEYRPDGRGGVKDYLSVAGPQRRTAKDHASRRTSQTATAFGQPRRSIIILQGDALPHLLDVGRGMQIIAIDIGQAGPA